MLNSMTATVSGLDVAGYYGSVMCEVEQIEEEVADSTVVCVYRVKHSHEALRSTRVND